MSPPTGRSNISTICDSRPTCQEGTTVHDFSCKFYSKRSSRYAGKGGKSTTRAPPACYFPCNLHRSLRECSYLVTNCNSGTALKIDFWTPADRSDFIPNCCSTKQCQGGTPKSSYFGGNENEGAARSFVGEEDITRMFGAPEH